MHRRDARALELRLEPQVEVGRVDADEEVRALADELRGEARADAQQLRQAAHRLDVAAHRELLHRHERAGARRDHPGAGDAVELGAGEPLAHRAHERRPEHVARCLAGDDGDAGPHQRTMPRVEVARKSTMAFTSGAASACRSSSALASARVSPDL